MAVNNMWHTIAYIPSPKAFSAPLKVRGIMHTSAFYIASKEERGE